MTTAQASSALEVIGDSTWCQLVGNLLGAAPSETLLGHTEKIFSGIGTGTEVFRVTGTARTAVRNAVGWTLVVKVLTQQRSAFHAAGRDPSAWNYWKREWHAYRSTWLPALLGPLVAARCLGTGEVEPTDGSGGVAWIAMEDLATPVQGPLTQPQFREVARHLGIFNGRYLDGRDLPTDPWLSRHWLRGWTEQAEPMMSLLPTAARHPVAGRIFTDDVIDDLEWAWDHRQALYATLDELPQTLCHNDLFPRNLFVGHGPDPRTVAIDWAFCGPAPIGQELVALVSATQVFRECPVDQWEALERTCLDGYLAGLRDTGSAAGEEAYVGYLLSTVLRFGVGAVPPLLGSSLTTEHTQLISEVFACSYAEFIDHCVAGMRFQQRRIRQARAILGL